MVDHADPQDSQNATATSALEIGGVLLFSGLTELEDRIRRTLHSSWTRSAVIVPGPDGTPAVLQGTSRPIASDVVDHTTRSGVQIVAVRDVFTSFAGSIAFRAIRPVISPQLRESLARFAMATRGVPFNTSPYYSLRAAHRRNREGNGRQYFCTELVAAALQEIGVLTRPLVGRSASNYVPGDFAQESEDVCLSEGYKLGSQVVVRCPIGFVF
jgi:hypothetical protein